MFSISAGKRFIGYGATVECPHCNNRVVEQIFNSFEEWGLAFVPLWNMGGVYPHSICHICHTVLVVFDDKDLLTGTSPRLAERLILMKDATLDHVKKLTWVQRRQHLGDLRRLKLVNFAHFIEAGCS